MNHGIEFSSLLKFLKVEWLRALGCPCCEFDLNFVIKGVIFLDEVFQYQDLKFPKVSEKRRNFFGFKSLSNNLGNILPMAC